jgi:hypothetical protein
MTTSKENSLTHISAIASSSSGLTMNSAKSIVIHTTSRTKICNEYRVFVNERNIKRPIRRASIEIRYRGWQRGEPETLAAWGPPRPPGSALWPIAKISPQANLMVLLNLGEAGGKILVYSGVVKVCKAHLHTSSIRCMRAAKN